MINEYTSYITVLRCWNTAARKHPIQRENGPQCIKHWKPLSETLNLEKSNGNPDHILHSGKLCIQATRFITIIAIKPILY